MLAVHERAVCLAPPSPNMQSYFGIVQEKAVGQSEGWIMHCKLSSTLIFSSPSLCDNCDHSVNCYVQKDALRIEFHLRHVSTSIIHLFPSVCTHHTSALNFRTIMPWGDIKSYFSSPPNFQSTDELISNVVKTILKQEIGAVQQTRWPRSIERVIDHRDISGCQIKRCSLIQFMIFDVEAIRLPKSTPFLT